MGSATKNMLIGTFIIAACTLLIGIVMFLKPSVGDGKKTLYVRFANINKVNVGTRVTYAGKPVGEVVAISEIYQPRSQPIDTIGRFYFYQLTLKVDSSVVVYNTDEISLQTSGLLGEKSVAIIPRRPPKGMTPKVISNQPIYANSVDPIENAFNELSGVAKKMNETFDEITKWMKNNGDTVACSIKNFGDAMHQIDKVVADVNESGLISEIHGATHEIKESFAKIRDAMTIMETEGTFQNIAAISKSIKQASSSIDVVTQDLADGKGTLGKLIKNDDLYLRFTAVMSKADTLMNDVNQYGVLFHLNKGWQRTHAQRATQITALNTPESFKSYFEKEVDQVNTSMERISMLINRASETPEKEKILQNDLFKEDFAELLRKVNELSDNLKLYNQQLMEAAQ